MKLFLLTGEMRRKLSVQMVTCIEEDLM